MTEHSLEFAGGNRVAEGGFVAVRADRSATRSIALAVRLACAVACGFVFEQSGGARLAGAAPAQASSDVGQVPAGSNPAWWGGWEPTLDAAFEAASAWGNTTRSVGPATRGRGWVTADGRWAVGVGVRGLLADRSGDPNVDEMELDALEMVARDRAVRAIAVSRLLDRDPIAVHGALGRSGETLRWKVSSAPRTRAYRGEDRVYAIAVLAAQTLTSLSLDGVDLSAARALEGRRARGLLQLSGEVGDSSRAVPLLIAAVREPDCDMQTLLGAARQAIRFERSDLAEEWVRHGLETREVELAPETISRLDDLVDRLEIDAPMVRALASENSLEGRLGLLAERVSASIPETWRRTLLWVSQDDTNHRILLERVRPGDPAEQAEAARWRSRFGETPPDSTVAIGWRGRLVPVETERAMRPVGGAPPVVRDLPVGGDGHVATATIAGTGAAADGEMARPNQATTQVKVSMAEGGTWSQRRRRLVAKAVFAWCLDQCRLAAVSRPEFIDRIEAGTAAEVAPWVLSASTDDDAYVVHLSPSAVSKLVAAIPNHSNRIGLVWDTPDKAIEGVDAVTAKGWRSLVETAVEERLDAAGIEVVGKAASPGQAVSQGADRAGEPPSTEPPPSLIVSLTVSSSSGDEPGRFGRPKPFTDGVVALSISPAGRSPLASIEVPAGRVYGDHPVEDAWTEAIVSAAGRLADALIDADLRAALEPGLLRISPFESSPEPEIAFARSAASRCGLVEAGDGSWSWPGGEPALQIFAEAVRRLGMTPPRDLAVVERNDL